MADNIQEWDRAGFEVVDGKLERKKDGINSTNIRCAREKARQADLRAHDTGPLAKLERHPGNGTMGAVPVQKRTGLQVLIRVTAIRARLLDEDNLAAKFHIDLLRYASGGALGDSPATTRIEVRQQKAQAGEREEVLLEVFEV